MTGSMFDNADDDPPQQERQTPRLLPGECMAKVLSFLTLRDVLSYGCTCTCSLKEILLDLSRRRELLKCDYACSQYDKSLKAWKVDGKTEDSDGTDNSMYFRIPSVLERVNQLNRLIPLAHPLSSCVADLMQHIQESMKPEETELESFKELLAAMQNLVKPHKLHAHILCHAMIPFLEYDSVIVDDALDRYIGDVWCVTLLLDQSHWRMVEGGPDRECFWRHALKAGAVELGERRRAITYHAWVALHSEILRRKAFSKEDRQRLSLPTNCHPSAFQNGIPSALAELMSTDVFSSHFWFWSSSMALVMNDFGGLSMAFFYRGRDDVRVLDLDVTSLIASVCNDRDSTEGRAEELCLEWLRGVHQQSRMARPMSVHPPRLRLTLGARPPMI